MYGACFLAEVDLGLGSKQPADLEKMLMIARDGVPQLADFKGVNLFSYGGKMEPPLLN